jgi:hypothetical protein
VAAYGRYVELGRHAVLKDRESLVVPRPFRSGLSLAAIGVLPLVAGLVGLIRPLSGLVFAAIFAAGGALQCSLAYHELAGRRRLADRELRRWTRPYRQPSLVAWRSAELISHRHRTALARSVARTVRDLSPATLPGASPLNRVAARPHVDLFRQLAGRLAALDRPVTPQAVLQVKELLTSPESPLYARERAHELAASLIACLRALDNVPDALVAESSPASRHDRFRWTGSANGGLAVMTSEPNMDSLRAHHSRLRRFAAARRRSQ